MAKYTQLTRNEDGSYIREIKNFPETFYAQLPYHPQHDPYAMEGDEVELAGKEEAKENILKQYSHYIDGLVVFHTDTMELLRHIDFHWVGTDNRLATKAKIEALIKQGKELEYNDSDDSHINFPNSHNSYGVKDYTRRKGEDEIH